MTAFVLLMFIASSAIIVGVLQIWGAIQLRKEIENEWLLDQVSSIGGASSEGQTILLHFRNGCGFGCRAALEHLAERDRRQTGPDAADAAKGG